MSLQSGHGTLWRILPIFWSFELYRVLLKESNSIHHFYCQIKMMLTWELGAVLLDKGKWKMMKAVLLLVPSGSWVQAPVLQLAHQVYSVARQNMHSATQTLSLCYMYSKGQILLPLTITWITDSFKYRALWGWDHYSSWLPWMEENREYYFKGCRKADMNIMILFHSIMIQIWHVIVKLMELWKWKFIMMQS